ncbi:MAG: hypothetical protein FIB04_00650 [Gammaproteobacteria bacterium]|nr:hypothetical protein [Gammaproteobacteria bacterium]
MRHRPVFWSRCLAATLLFAWFAACRADGINVLETSDLRVVNFAPAGDYLVPYATQCFLNALAAQKKLFGYAPDGKASVLLQDFSDRGNATTVLAAPRDRVFIDVAPVTLAFETFSPGERMFTVANHETVHLVTSDMASPADMRFRRLFAGKVAPVAEHPESVLYYYLTVPRASSPRWYQEGSAVFMETWLGGGLGRAQGGYDEMVFRAMVRDGVDFYDPLALVSKGTEVDFQVGANAYLYGTRFMSYLGLEYGPEKLIEWWRRGPDSDRYYADEFRRVFGLPLDQAWQDWVRWEHGFQEANLKAVREHPITAYRDVAPGGLGAISRAYLSVDGTKLYAAVRYPGRVPHLVEISIADGKVRELQEVLGAVPFRVTSLAYDPATGTLFYTTDNTTYRNLMALDLKTGKSRMLLKAARIGDLAFNPQDRSLWGLRTNNGFAILVRIPYPYTEWKSVHVFPYSEVPFDLDISPDGTLLSTSVAGPDEKNPQMQVMQVRVMQTAALLAGDATPYRKFMMGSAVPEGFVFSRDGRFLLGSSFYTGVSNIYRYELETGKLDALSNAEIGFFHPIPLDDSRLIVFHYTGRGFVPAIITPTPTEDLSAITFLGEQVATRRPVVQGWVAGSPASVDYQSQVLRQGSYSAARELALESIYPVIQGFKDSVSYGIHARFSDPIGFDTLALTAGYTPDDSLPGRQRGNAEVKYQHSFWTLGARWNAADFYDLFGPTKVSRAGYSGYVAYDRPIIYDPPEKLNLIAHAAYYGDLDKLPAFQNVPAPYTELATADVGVLYKHPRSSIGSVDDETGHNWAVVGHVYQANGELIPSLIGEFDLGFPLPVGHASIWSRNAAGVSSGDRSNPLVNAYFGGFGNNWVDHGDPKRYRDVFSLPGFDIDALGGKSFVKSILEFNLPPLRFEAAGTPAFHASWARPAIFATALVLDPQNGGYRQSAYDVGAQVDFQLQVLHRLPMMLSFGYAVGYDGDGLGKGEFMASLKIL